MTQKSLRRYCGSLPQTSFSSNPRWAETPFADFLETEVNVLLPFLNSLEVVEVYDDATLIGSATVSPRDRATNSGPLTVTTTVNGITTDASFFQMRFEVSNFVRCPKAGRHIGRVLREMKKASIVLSARLVNGQPISDNEAYFHVYFPDRGGDWVGLRSPRRLLCKARPYSIDAKRI